ncbi:ROK family protein [Sediminitomix flava]|uniref:Glucokinase n=1 Tax=Sediminitomix flava TaxID=379075 RepID=A0A315ZFH5_SEDFL|nr:ROK family protein [Sediminitomix flava]PWJ43909.1 glucokinase [Sediminitomix flava]
MKEVTLGIDIGGTNTKLGFVDEKGKVHGESSIPTFADQSIDIFLERLTSQVDLLKKEIKESMTIVAIGIGAPNANFHNGKIEKAPNLKAWGDDVPLAYFVNKALHLPVYITNDANAAALGELQFGAAKGLDDVIVITLGTGLGSGIIVNGELATGHDGFAGELGHVSVKFDGRICGCGKKGCLETYVSATGIKRTVFKMLCEHNGNSVLSNVAYDDLDAAMISEAANNRDAVALEAFDYTGMILGIKLADTVAHLSPAAFILTGGLANAGHLITEPTKKYMEQNLMPIFKGKVKILTSGIKDANPAILGSGALAWQEYKKNTPPKVEK